MKNQKLAALFVVVCVVSGCILPPKKAVVNPAPKNQQKAPPQVTKVAEAKDSNGGLPPRPQECSLPGWTCWPTEYAPGRYDWATEGPEQVAAAPTQTAQPASAPTVTTSTPKPELKQPGTEEELATKQQLKQVANIAISTKEYVDSISGMLGLPALPGYNLVGYATEQGSNLNNFGEVDYNLETCRLAGQLPRVKNEMGSGIWIVPNLMIGTSGVRTDAIGNETNAYFCSPRKGSGELLIRFYKSINGKAVYWGRCTFDFNVQSSTGPGGSTGIRISKTRIKEDGKDCHWGPE